MGPRICLTRIFILMGGSRFKGLMGFCFQLRKRVIVVVVIRMLRYRIDLLRLFPKLEEGNCLKRLAGC
ncbi:hypothetical protein KSS87_022629 [Heliosperma pusillum]|nr:hypothetical protein KSS87_022629 [Heliosperma pusillum]